MYKLIEITPINKLLSKDLKAIYSASEIAEKSIFDVSKRLGALLRCKGNNYVGENQHREKYGNVFHRSFHAEMNALFKSIKNNKKTRKMTINKVDKNMTPMTIYVVRLGAKSGIYGNAKPCENCQKFLHFNNVRKIKYTDIIDGINVLCTLKIV